jgi:hypothetical protein
MDHKIALPATSDEKLLEQYNHNSGGLILGGYI